MASLNGNRAIQGNRMQRQTDHFSRVSIETSDYDGQMIKPFPPIILTSLTMALNSAPAQNAADGHRPNIL
jgi:hypothetical protein